MRENRAPGILSDKMMHSSGGKKRSSFPQITRVLEVILGKASRQLNAAIASTCFLKAGLLCG